MADALDRLRGPWAGPAITVASAVLFALNTPFAAFAYESGATPTALVLLRTGTAGIVALAIAYAVGTTGLNRIVRRKAFWLASLAMATQGVCYLASVSYIPVGLAAIIFYTWPLLVAISEPFVGGGRHNKGQLACFALAFLGLLLAVGPSFETIHPIGLVFVALGALSMPVFMHASRRLLPETDVWSYCGGLNLGATAVTCLALPFLGPIAFADTTAGQAGAVALALCYTAGILTQVTALRLLSASTVAMLFNLEPIVSILAGFLLLGEVLTGTQYLGGAIVVAALVLFARLR